MVSERDNLPIKINETKHSPPEPKNPEDIPEYDMEEGFKVLCKKIRGELEGKEIIIVAVAGGSAAGKTTTGWKIEVEFPGDARTLSMDDYYHGQTFIEKQKDNGVEINWDQPEAVNFDLLKDHLEKLKRGEIIQKPVYDFTNCKPKELEAIKPAKIIVVEGLFTLVDELKDFSDLKVFIDTSPYLALFRRIPRDQKRAGKKPKEVVSYFRKIVKPQYERLVKTTKSNADIVLKNNRHRIFFEEVPPDSA